MPQITVNLTQSEYDAMGVMTVTPEEWVQHATEDKARRLIDVIVADNSNLNVKKMTKAEKHAKVSTVDLIAEKTKRVGTK